MNAVYGLQIAHEDPKFPSRPVKYVKVPKRQVLEHL